MRPERVVCEGLMDFASWVDHLSPDDLNALAVDVAATLERDGLTVFRAEDGQFLPIPPVLSPESLPRERMAELSRDAHLLIRALAKLAAWTLDAGRDVGRLLYRNFSPLEQAVLAQGPARLFQVATARVDYFIDPTGRARALEVNATIPAMQGYSDLIAHTWVRTIARECGRSLAESEGLVAATGSNVSDLLAALVARYRASGGENEQPSILIVSRRGDAQLGELLHYRYRWSLAGHRTEHVWVDEVDLDSHGRVTAHGRTWDIIYRHIFARRVEPGSPFERLLLDPPSGVTIVNPVVGPLEVKGLLALLHQFLDDESRLRNSGIDGEERGAIKRVVPWTRLLLPGPATLADGTAVADLPHYVASHPEGLVLKRSWDYGGKSVILGTEAEEASTQARMREATGETCWAAFVLAAARQENMWVVQEFVPPTAHRHLLIEREPDGRIRARWRDLFVDLSAFCNLGDLPQPNGGACRASASRIVNILGGGGLAPLIPTDVMDKLLAEPPRHARAQRYSSRDP